MLKAVAKEPAARYHRAEQMADDLRREVRDAPAFLATATMRLAINLAHSARARHEAPGDGWLREPVDGPGPRERRAPGAVDAEDRRAAAALLVVEADPVHRARSRVAAHPASSAESTRGAPGRRGVPAPPPASRQWTRPALPRRPRSLS